MNIEKNKSIRKQQREANNKETKYCTEPTYITIIQ